MIIDSDALGYVDRQQRLKEGTIVENQAENQASTRTRAVADHSEESPSKNPEGFALSIVAGNTDAHKFFSPKNSSSARESGVFEALGTLGKLDIVDNSNSERPVILAAAGRSDRAEQGDQSTQSGKRPADIPIILKAGEPPALPEESAAKTAAIDEPDSDHVDVGKPLSWSAKMRELARPAEGQGYYDVMKGVGEQMLGRTLAPDEVNQLVTGARALQAHRGKDASTLTTHDELLPKNMDELTVFMNNFGKGKQGKLTGSQILELQQKLSAGIENQQTDKPAEVIVMDLRPVNDQVEVTKVVPDAVYIDSSHIEGGQGYRRKPDCTNETQNYWLSKATAEALMKVQKTLLDAGEDPLVLRNMNGAGRRALDRELIKECAPNQPHAKKRSQHEFGISIDVDNYDKQSVRDALTKHGFVHNVPGDRPHFTYLPRNRR